MDRKFVERVSAKDMFPLFESIRKSLVHYFASHLVTYPSAGNMLAGKCGVFVTYRDGKGNVRGSMGLLDTDRPLYQSAIDCAISAVKDDPRYERIIINDVNSISIEITLIDNIWEITNNFESASKMYKPGTHGFYVETDILAGVLLPREIVNEKINSFNSAIERLNSKCNLPSGKGARYHMFSSRVFLQTAAGSEVIEL
ncbi:MAG: AMMECR1 domain-containing protein [Candidatus Micrarchaeia archaeon]